MRALIFSGPRHTTAVSRSIRWAMEITLTPLGPVTGSMSVSLPTSLDTTSASSTPMIIAMSGPVTSASTRPVLPSLARTQARFAATEDFPTPPFPDMTTILCLIRPMRWAIFMRSRMAAMM